MKIIKVTKKYSVARYHNHTAGFRFKSWCNEARDIEAILREMHGTSGWFIKWFNMGEQPWASWTGRGRNTTDRPYFITVKDPADITVVLLKRPDLTHNSV